MSYIEIKLPTGEFTIVDSEDVDLLKNYKWRLSGAGYVAYNKVENGQHSIYLHRLIMKCTPMEEVDHINNNKLDNRKSNLRICTRMENCRKRGKPKRKNKLTSKYKGVSFQSGRYRARIRVNNKELSLGRFKNEEDAALAYNEAALLYFGKYANINILETK